MSIGRAHRKFHVISLSDASYQGSLTSRVLDMKDHSEDIYDLRRFLKAHDPVDDQVCSELQ